MPQHVRLSNGSALDIPDGTAPDQIRARVGQAEAAIKIGANTPSAGDNFTHELARRAVGAYQLYHNTMQPAAESAGRVAGAGADIAFPPAGIYDFAASGANAVKPILAEKYPALKNVPNAPIISDYATRLIGAPPLPVDAPWWQRYGEGAATGVTQGIKTAAKFVASQATGDIGQSVAQRFGGPDWTQFGRWLGGIPGSVPEKVFASVREGVKWAFAAPQSEQDTTTRSAQTLDPNNPPDTFGTRATRGGKMLERAFGAVPGVNIPINYARQRLEDAILAARDNASQAINKGQPLPPTFGPETIGQNLINQARAKSLSIKNDASQRYQDLYNAVPSSTLLNARPILNAIRQYANTSTDISGAQKNELLARADYLESMTYGNPGYNGPTFGPGATPVGAITLGQLAKFKTELGQDLGTMTKIDQRANGPVYNAVDTAMQGTFNRLGYGPQYAAARDNYNAVIGDGTITDRLDAIGGTPVYGKPAGAYEGGLNTVEAHALLARSGHASSEIADLQGNTPYWNSAISQYLSTLGQTGQGADFRPDKLGPQLQGIEPPAMSIMTGEPQPGPGVQTPITDQLRAAEDLGNKSTMGVRRSGLSDAAGGLLALGSVMESGRHFLADHGMSPTLIVPIMMAAGYGMQSQPMLDAMAGRTTTTPLVDALYQAMPIASSAYGLDNPNDPNRQAQPTDTPRPRSPLDQLNQPNQFLPPKAGAPSAPSTLPQGAPAPNPFTPPNMNPPAAYNF